MPKALISNSVFNRGFGNRRFFQSHKRSHAHEVYELWRVTRTLASLPSSLADLLAHAGRVVHAPLESGYGGSLRTCFGQCLRREMLARAGRKGVLDSRHRAGRFDSARVCIQQLIPSAKVGFATAYGRLTLRLQCRAGIKG